MENNSYYRSLQLLKAPLEKDLWIKSALRAFSNAKNKDNYVDIISYDCDIDKEWVAKIKYGLDFVENAINENRQFINTNGEVVNIEKMKSVSKESVIDLSKHSNYITHINPDSSDIIPDKILKVEKLNDFAVYENRFLYYLLKQLELFITSRYEKISQKLNSYISHTSLKKKVTTSKSALSYSVSLDDEKNNYINLIKNDTMEDIEGCLYTINMLLKTELMQIVGKVNMIQPPIVLTNILKMDNNFRETVDLYNYISTYKGEGFTLKEKKVRKVFDEESLKEFNNTVLLANFISFASANDLFKDLAKEYEIENRKIREEELNELDQKLNELETKLKNGENVLNEYLEANLKYREFVAEEFNKRDEIIKEEQEKALKSIEENNLNWQNKVNTLTDDFMNKEKTYIAECNANILNITNEKDKYLNLSNEYETKLNNEIAAHQSDNERLNKEISLRDASLITYRAKNGETTIDDFKSEDSFKLLEKDQEVFMEFYNKSWKQVKKDMRKSMLISVLKKDKKGKVNEQEK